MSTKKSPTPPSNSHHYPLIIDTSKGTKTAQSADDHYPYQNDSTSTATTEPQNSYPQQENWLDQITPPCQHLTRTSGFTNKY